MIIAYIIAVFMGSYCVAEFFYRTSREAKQFPLEMYELEAVGVSTYEIDKALKSDFEPAAIVPEPMEYYADKDLPGFKRVFWTYQTKGSPLRCKVATKEQVEKWPELTSYRDLRSWEQRPYLLWRKQ